MSEQRFTYSLQALYSLRLWKQNALLRRLARAQQALTQQEQLVQQSHSKMRSLSQDCVRNRQINMSIAGYQQNLVWMSHLREKLLQQEEHLGILRGEKNEAFDAYKRSEISFEAVNKHREKIKHEHQKLQLAHDAKQADEDWRIRRDDFHQIDAYESTGATHA